MGPQSQNGPGFVSSTNGHHVKAQSPAAERDDLDAGKARFFRRGRTDHLLTGIGQQKS